ncbi:hypothetical protein [Paractinoplanes maris]|uniref:hypothetical protein n=1 Tax=Paractinoplanes maris TaxID=1734446 RepID=UPI002021783D|nr:hypothetical protein [Actinoplanes maris]
MDSFNTTAPEPGFGGERGGGDLLLGVLAGSALAPFLQAVATKAGEDVYAKIRDLLTRRRASPPPAAPEAPLILADPQTRTAIRLPATLTSAEAARLAAVHVPAHDGGRWIIVDHAADGAGWTVQVADRLPDGAIEVQNPS